MAKKRIPIPPEKVFLDNVMNLVKNMFVDNPNYTNGYYLKDEGSVSDLIADTQERGRYALEEIEKTKHLIIDDPYPWTQFNAFSKDTNTRVAKKGDKLRVINTVCTCCCEAGKLVEVLDVSSRGDLTIACPVFGTHDHGFAYNRHFRFET